MTRHSGLRAGILSNQWVRHFNLEIGPGLAYYLIGPNSSIRKNSVKAARDWLLEQSQTRSNPASLPA